MSKPLAKGQFTGKHMLATMVAFFGTIIAVNVTMAVYANTSWTGFVVRNSYVAGLEFNKKTQEARKQAALGWTSQMAVHDGQVVFALRDDKDASIALAEGTATFRRPTSDAEDMSVTLSAGPEGTLAAPVAIADGSWIVEFNLATRDGTQWHEMDRILLDQGQTR
jgi:nitrogen fixation protein FixH